MNEDLTRLLDRCWAWFEHHEDLVNDGDFDGILELKNEIAAAIGSKTAESKPLFIVFDPPTYTTIQPERVVERAVMSSGKIVVMSESGESFWFYPTGRNPKGSHLTTEVVTDHDYYSSFGNLECCDECGARWNEHYRNGPWYHGTSKETWAEIQREGYLWGKRDAPSRCTYLSTTPEDAAKYGDVVLRVRYAPVPGQDNYVPGCWQFRAYYPIPIDCVEIATQDDSSGVGTRDTTATQEGAQ